ncbi:ragulator complex protein LAMTOR4 isoform X1 [Parambassis ranga]|uniref:Ragulator complex protein LAMTOR4 n=1 Tax=Parambassis ranga TaxID=210632 RepID=A0A6P7I1Q2_9TELE|nr:ragulator complex protein LAMTOR4 isoform X1 [Parambassis ranga]
MLRSRSSLKQQRRNDDSRADCRSGANPGSARVPGHQRGGGSGRECSLETSKDQTQPNQNPVTCPGGHPYTRSHQTGKLLSAGELENDEHTAGVIMQMVRTASRFRLSGSAEPPFKRLSVILEDFVYAITVSGQKVFVVKRQHNQQEPINV